MHTKIRRSATKGRKMTGFRYRMKTKSGRKIINRQRRRACGKGKLRGRVIDKAFKSSYRLKQGTKR